MGIFVTVTIQHYVTGSFLTSFLLLFELVLLLAVLFVLIWNIGIWYFVVMAIVWWWWFPSAIQAREFCGTDLLRAGGSGHAPWVLSPALLSRTAARGHEALSHGCSGLVTPLTSTSPLLPICMVRIQDNISNRDQIYLKLIKLLKLRCTELKKALYSFSQYICKVWPKDLKPQSYAWLNYIAEQA